MLGCATNRDVLLLATLRYVHSESKISLLNSTTKYYCSEYGIQKNINIFILVNIENLKMNRRGQKITCLALIWTPDLEQFEYKMLTLYFGLINETMTHFDNEKTIKNGFYSRKDFHRLSSEQMLFTFTGQEKEVCTYYDR